VQEFLDFIAGTHGLKGSHRKRVAEMVELTGLQTEQHKKIGALSKGYRQRVGLAQALIHDPEVLILDEPTSGLDPNQLLEIRSLILEIGKRKTVMMSTHIMQEVEAICNRVIIIHKGSIVVDDSTQNLQHIGSRAMVKVEFSSEVSSELLCKIPGVVDVKSPNSPNKQSNNQTTKSEVKIAGSNILHPASGILHPAGCIWHLSSESGRDIRADVFKFAVDNQLTVLSLQLEEQKLEEVFQELTKN
jgi:ABC-2 type transport system ATP-binding protein